MMKVRHAIPLYRCFMHLNIKKWKERVELHMVPIVVKTLLILSFECILGLTIENSKLGFIYCGFNSQLRHVKFWLVTKPSHVQNQGT
jgi:uncharacterized membrane protein SirB2